MQGLAQFVKWEAHGFQVAGTAYSVDEGLAFLERHPVDVVFLDIRMPKKTGLDMLKVMHSVYPETKAVILSGFSEFFLCTGGCPLRGGGLSDQACQSEGGGGASGQAQGGIHEAGDRTMR